MFHLGLVVLAVPSVNPLTSPGKSYYLGIGAGRTTGFFDRYLDDPHFPGENQKKPFRMSMGNFHYLADRTSNYGVRHSGYIYLPNKENVRRSMNPILNQDTSRSYQDVYVRLLDKAYSIHVP